MNDRQVANHIANLRHKDPDVRRHAANALGEVGDPGAVPALIGSLSDRTDYVRRKAVLSLKKIGAPSVPALARALRTSDDFVREAASEALMDFGDASALPGVIEALKDNDVYVREAAVKVLGKIGDASVAPTLMEALQDESMAIRCAAADALGHIGDVWTVPALLDTWRKEDSQGCLHIYEALRKIGDEVVLPRKILADPRFSAQQRIDMLVRLRRVSYAGNDHSGNRVLWRYPFAYPPELCEEVLREEDAEARKGAQAVLNWLNGERHLLHASQEDHKKQSQELVRPSYPQNPNANPKTLLRAAEPPELPVKTPPPTPTLWQRLLGNDKGATS